MATNALTRPATTPIDRLVTEAELKRATFTALGLRDEHLTRAGETIVAALDANDRFGQPAWDARLKAATLLAQLGYVTPDARAKATGNTSGQGGSVTVVLAPYAAPPQLQHVDVIEAETTDNPA